MTAMTFAREVVSGGPAALPRVNTPVTVSPAVGEAEIPPVEARSRVEDVLLRVAGRRPGPTEVVLARPVFQGDLESEWPGARYVVRWVTERGVHEVPCRYLDRELIGPRVLGWRVAVTGPVSRLQRRAHARVDLAVPIQLTFLTREDDRSVVTTAQVNGLTINLSEGGVLAALRPCEPHLSAAVVARFEIARQPFVLAGKVVRVQPVPGRLGGPGVAVQFDRPDEHGDRLRPLLFAHQLNARRIGVA
jgi:hypothetical protein